MPSFVSDDVRMCLAAAQLLPERRGATFDALFAPARDQRRVGARAARLMCLSAERTEQKSEIDAVYLFREHYNLN